MQLSLRQIYLHNRLRICWTDATDSIVDLRSGKFTVESQHYVGGVRLLLYVQILLVYMVGRGTTALPKERIQIKVV